MGYLNCCMPLTAFVIKGLNKAKTSKFYLFPNKSSVKKDTTPVNNSDTPAKNAVATTPTTNLLKRKPTPGLKL